MKRTSVFFSHFLIVCIVASGFAYIASCKNEAEKPSGDNKIELTSTYADIVAYFSTSVSANLTNHGGNTITDHGFCYATSPNPDINTNNKSLGKITNTGSFNISINTELTGLNDNTKYYNRAYASFAGSTFYLEHKEFTTLKAGKPHINTNELSDITPVSAICGGSIVSDSGYSVTASGICWDTDNQFTENKCLGKSINNSGNAAYSLNITGLTEGTTYYVKTWATNQKGTSYGETRQFSSATVTIPTVTTIFVTIIWATTAECGGKVTHDGFKTITTRGVCWNTTDNPTLQNCLGFTTDCQGTGTFTSNVAGLPNGVTNYVKAYATNAKSTGFEAQQNITTLEITIPSVTTSSITNPTTNSATGGGNVTNSGNATVTTSGLYWKTTGNPNLQNCLGFTTDGSETSSFTNNITGLTANTSYAVKAYATNTAGTGYRQEKSFTTNTPWSCGTSSSITHSAGTISPVNKSVNYGSVETNLTSSTKCWITQNLGADRQATSATDAAEASAGWYWQFNKKQGFKHDGTTRTPNATWISYINENSDWLPANDPCTLLLGSGWRLPTITEWETADTTGGWDNYNETFATVLKLHAAGSLNNSTGSLNYRGSNGYYWSSSQLDSGIG